MNLTTEQMYALVQILNRYLGEHPDGENAEAARQLVEKLMKFLV